MKKNLYIIICLLLLMLFLASATLCFFLWQEIKNFEPNVFYKVPTERSFIYNEKNSEELGIENYLLERVTIKRNEFIQEERDFIDVNLKKMELTLYQGGEFLEVFDIQSKGRKDSWWETAPGVYFVGDKLVKHFSSISRVWMPYAIQFYGNFFIHGWPYYTSGQPLALGPSGGCVRLKTEDAAIVFDFVERGMPVLVFDQKDEIYLEALKIDFENFPFDIISQSALIADLDTGEIILSKEIESEISANLLIGGMFALALSEVVSSDKRLVARDWMFQGIRENIIIPGRSYRVHDLLDILLKKHSQEAVSVLIRFINEEYFLELMNIKARAIGMNNTFFDDITGQSKKNKTTLYDTVKLAKYIKDYRGFIFEMSIPNEKMNKEIENIIGFLSGINNQEQESVIIIWQTGLERNIFIGLGNSLEIEEDIEKVIFWLKNL